ncbi:MAG: dynamin family protein [Oscillospiraceae bacterium]|nr:dynamin family protein [Oscillospiraceae bacterium]
MNPFFVEALDMREHPIKKSKSKIRSEYISALTYIIQKTVSELDESKTEVKQYVFERLRLYHTQLLMNDKTTKKDSICLLSFKKPWRSKYRFMLICDVALILLDDSLIHLAVEIMKESLSIRRNSDIERIMLLLKNQQIIDKKYLLASSLIIQYRLNKNFISKEEKRIIVTANMSTGKSTLINALIGKPVARTSQEVCTGNVCYLYNKAYEDENTHLSTKDISLRATADELSGYDWNGHISIASYFARIESDIPRLCLIDTPGVDAALYKEHSKYARNALLNDVYDAIIYVVSPTRLGTDAEKKHLQWVAQNLHTKKIIFVLNKLDCYHNYSDSVEESINGFKNDLQQIGFENPVICPISAYFSYLVKLKMTGQTLSEDEADEYALYSKKFNKPSYDLSQYYKGVQCLPTDSEEIALSKRVGLYGLERIIYGGNL